MAIRVPIDAGVNAHLDPRLSGHLVGHSGDTNSHGTEGCPTCGGYQATLSNRGDAIQKMCRNCSGITSTPKKNTLKDFLGATVADYD